MKLGARVCVSAKYRRHTHHMNDRSGRDTKTWQRWSFGTPKEGIYIGYRTLSDGIRDYIDEYGYTYEAKEHFKALLVVFSECERPVLVPCDAVEELSK